MGFKRAASSGTANSSGVQQTQALSINTQASPQTQDSASSSTPHSSPWRENAAFLPPNNPTTSSHPVVRNILPEVTDKLADMSVVGSGLQRAQDSGQMGKDAGPSTAHDTTVHSVAGNVKANALGRFKDRQQQGMRKTLEDETQDVASSAPAKYYLQVPIKPFKP